MKCKVENNEIVLRIPIENLADYYCTFCGVEKVVDKRVYKEFADQLLDLEGYGGDKEVNLLLDNVAEKVLEDYPEYFELNYELNLIE